MTAAPVTAAPSIVVAALAALGALACQPLAPTMTSADAAAMDSLLVPSPVASRLPVGVGTHGLRVEDVERLRYLGVRYTRYTLYWSRWSDPAYRAAFRDGVARVRAAGIRPLIVVHADPPELGGYAQRFRVYRAFADFMAARAAEMPGTEWELWNEMDRGFTTIFGASDPTMPPQQRGRMYGEHLRLVYPAIKAADPTATVVTGGTATYHLEFIRGFAMAAPGFFDVVAVHTYGPPSAFTMRHVGPAVRRLLASLGTPRPVWSTEFGIDNDDMSRAWGLSDSTARERAHLEDWQRSIYGNDRYHWLDRIYGYQLLTDPPETHGLFRPDGTPRQTAVWLAGYERETHAAAAQPVADAP